MDLSLLVLTINGQDKLPHVLPSLQGIADELVVGIDDKTEDNTAAIAHQYTDKVYPVRHEGFCGDGRKDHPNAVEDMLPYCSGQWVLRVDHDETLSPLWSNRKHVTSLLQDRYATHYWIPRRWVVPPGTHFISNRRWYPDYQLRLFRNLPSLVRFNRLAHEPPVIAGEARKLTRAWINHWDYVWHDRRIREAKVLFYKGFSPYTGEDYYLYEDYHYQTKRLDYIHPCSFSAPMPATAAPYSISVRVIDAPAQMCAGETDSILIEITNHSERVLRPPSHCVNSGNVNVSYHWYRAGNPPVVHEWDGERRVLPGRIAPGESMEDFLAIRVPREPGDYLLQPDLVEEQLTWYSYHSSLPAIPITVIDGD